ncbi:hypothetical protein [Streptomyces halobius]|uniref:Uncharacterized protein n=1 Tax=Streptomyces halobius TaxID=2879846 RepID=A0ABY4M770_9ACTN|nr:hypothetical protein [Streptomyces halobius]UQA93570.1 hypothetical protein K9S39_18460 [Streptomyces halobius]
MGQRAAAKTPAPAAVPWQETAGAGGLAAGEDRVGGWWVSGDRFLSLNLIACSPHRVRPEYRCPLHLGE